MLALEHMAQGLVLWLEATTRDNVSIIIVNVRQATANQYDLQRPVTYFLKVMIDAALTQRRILGGAFNTALSRLAMLGLQVRYMTRWTSFSRTLCIQRIK